LVPLIEFVRSASIEAQGKRARMPYSTLHWPWSGLQYR